MTIVNCRVIIISIILEHKRGLKNKESNANFNINPHGDILFLFLLGSCQYEFKTYDGQQDRYLNFFTC